MTQKTKIVKKLAAVAVTGVSAVSGIMPQAEAGMIVVPEVPKTPEQSTQDQKALSLSKAVDYVFSFVERYGYMPKVAGEKVAQSILDSKEGLNMPGVDGQLPVFRVLNFQNHKVGAEQTSMETMAVFAKLMMGQGARLDAMMKAPAGLNIPEGQAITVFDALLKMNPQMLKVLDAEMQKDIVIRRSKKSAGR